MSSRKIPRLELRDAPELDQLSSASPSASLASSINKFGSVLMQKLHRLNHGIMTNIALSPPSLAIAISMLVAGAKGETRSQIVKTLQLQTDDKILESMNSLMQQLAQPQVFEQPTIHISSFVFMKRGYEDKVKPEFKEFLRQQYQCSISYLAKEANSMVIFNSVNFKANWCYQFCDRYTKDDEFELNSEGQKFKCRMMNNTATYCYVQNSEVTIIQLPFEKERFNALVVLPRERHGLDKLLAKADLLNDVMRLMKSCKKEEVNFYLPKFQLNLKTSMAQPDLLPAMGMTYAFQSGTADLSGVAKDSDRLFVIDISQHVVLKVDENGAAALCSKALQKCLSQLHGTQVYVPKSLPLSIKVDQPFLFLITDNVTECVFLAIKVSNLGYNPDDIKINSLND